VVAISEREILQQMSQAVRVSARTRRFFGWMGAVSLLAIIPIKLVRVAGAGGRLAIGVAPSLLGPAGLLFLLLSGSGRLAKLSLLQQTVVVGTLAVVLELLQLCPRPGLLRYVHYTFDYFDLIASVLSVAAAYVVALAVIKRSHSSESSANSYGKADPRLAA
jgi:uncharacterized membrane protein